MYITISKKLIMFNVVNKYYAINKIFNVFRATSESDATSCRKIKKKIL